MTMPNFLIIGDFKAGTSSLYSYLRQHPQVYMPPQVKELRYFSFDAENAYQARARSTVVRTLEDYQSYFRDSGQALAIGEASPNYLRSPGAAARIQRQIPQVRLIACLRNPADRLHSAHQMRERSEGDKVPFDERLFGYDAAWIKANFYWLDLKRYFDLFDRSKICVILFDDLQSDPLRVAQEVYRFLGVDAAFEPDLTASNPGGIPASALAYRLMVALRRFVKRSGLASPQLRKAGGALEKKLLRRVPMDAKVRRQILEICRDDILRTQELIGRDLSLWLR